MCTESQQLADSSEWKNNIRDDPNSKMRRNVKENKRFSLLLPCGIIILASLVLCIYLHREALFGPDETLEPWESPIIHIINTRFMQNQGNLKTLAAARLHLFKTICLPSILHQTYHDFLWIIKIDPDLDEDIRNELIDSIHQAVETLLIESERRNTHATYGDIQQEHDSYSGSVDSLRQRIFVVGSNQNFGIGHDEGAWRGGLESKELLSHRTEKKGEIYMGDEDLLKMAQIAEPNKIVLETRLDADDGLNEGYVSYLHQDAMKKFHGIVPHNGDNLNVQGHGHGNKNEDDISSFRWLYWCVESHFKWYVSGEGESGQLGGEKRLDFCVTPGLTVGYNIGTRVKDVPAFGHHELVLKLRGNHNCIENDITTDTKILIDSNLDGSNGVIGGNGDDFLTGNIDEQVPCVEIVSGFIAAIRSRTLTSAGMNDVTVGRNTKASPDDLWDILEDRFGVMVEDAIETKRFFEENMKEIAIENLKGQCRPGHSCKESSKEKLKKIIDDSKKTTKD